MTLYTEIESFSRAFINGERTPERRKKIATAYRQLTNKKLRTSCSTCYVEAIFVILEKMKQNMPKCDYVLKKGARLIAFSDASKYCDNNNITNELAEWHLANNPSCAVKFAVMPPEPKIMRPLDSYTHKELADMIKKLKGDGKDIKPENNTKAALIEAINSVE